MKRMSVSPKPKMTFSYVLFYINNPKMFSLLSYNRKETRK